MSIIQKILDTFDWAKRFVTTDIWTIRLDDFPKYLATLLKYLRIILFSFSRISQDKIQLRASSLTYYSLLALVPILAMGFGVAKGFGFDKDLEQRLIENFAGHEEVLKWMLGLAQNMLSTTKGGLIAGVGLLILLWSVMKMMGNIESSFNDIWQVKKRRSYVRKFTNYLSMMLIAPVFIFLASSSRVFVATQLDNISSGIQVIDISPVVFFLIKIFPCLMTWILFTILYITLPYTKVKFWPAFVAGVVAGTAFLFVQWFYIYAQMGMSRYNVIYGSFAAVPLLLFWLRASCFIVLIGAELSYAQQNIDQYELEHESSKISQFANRAYILVLLENIVKRFIDDKPPQTAKEMAIEMDVPTCLARNALSDMLAAGLVFEVCSADSEKEYAYAPAKDVKRFTIKYIIEQLDKSGNNNKLTNPSQELSRALDIQESFLKVMENAPDNVLLQDLSSYSCQYQNKVDHG